MADIQKCRENIQAFANKHKVIFEDAGEVGFGRPCVGLLLNDAYVDYNPSNKVTYEPIQEYYNRRLEDIPPESAYHKHDCVAVLVNDGDYDSAILQLSEWVDELRKLNVSLEQYETGAIGLQVMITGMFGYCFKVNAKKENPHG